MGTTQIRPEGLGVLVAVLLQACGQPDGGASNAHVGLAAAGSLGQATPTEAEVAPLAQALGEPTCLTIAPDAVRDGLSFLSSEDGNYDHPGCRHGFIVDAQVQVGETITMYADPPVSEEPFVGLLGCGFNFAWFYVYQRAGDSYLPVLEIAKYAVIEGQFPRTRCNAREQYTPAVTGDYRIIIAGRSLLGNKAPVSVAFRPD